MRVVISLISFWFIHTYIHKDNGEIICDDDKNKIKQEEREEERIDLT